MGYLDSVLQTVEALVCKPKCKERTFFMKTGQRFFKKMMVALLSAAVIATMLPMVVMAAGNTIDDATVIKLDQKVQGELMDNNTVDWYKITLTSGGYLTINCQAYIHWVYYSLYYGDDAANDIFKNSNVCWDTNSEISNKTYTYYVNSGTYYFRVHRDGSYNGKYNFSIKLDPCTESFKEPVGGSNNSLSAANAISLNATYYGLIANAVGDDRDYYKFYLPADGVINIKANAYMNWIYYYIYDIDGKQVSKQNVCWDSVAQVSQRTLTYTLSKGYYYFCVIRDGNNGKYDFTISSNIVGWQKDSHGWWYRNNDGTFPTNKWQMIYGVWYYFNGSGYCVTGWNRIGGYWYYFDNNGAMQKGWTKVSGKWYHFDDSGKLQTGWIKLQGKWYHFADSGAMHTGWQQLQGKWYYFDANGVLQIGWIAVGGKWYHTDSNGVMQTGWQQLQGKWYYFESSGVMATNKWVDGYYLQADGSMR